MQHFAAFRRLDTFDRVALVDGPTPLEELDLPETKSRGIKLFIKRDDLGAVGGGGNKLRKLELALARAQAEGADSIITFGALQSNHARLTAAAASRIGLSCELVLSRRVPNSSSSYEGSGNLLLSRLFGARIHELQADDDPLTFSQALKARLTAEGKRVHIIPFGGSDRYGAIGMARVAVEIAAQLAQLGLKADRLVVASGSGGTQAGLMAGLRLASLSTALTGISVLHDRGRLAPIVSGLLDEAGEALHLDRRDDMPDIDDRFVGDGYGVTYPGMLSTIEYVARRSGIIFDPVYTGKAVHGLLQRIVNGEHDGERILVLVHTGGAPGLFAYADVIGHHLDRNGAAEYV